MNEDLELSYINPVACSIFDIPDKDDHKSLEQRLLQAEIKILSERVSFKKLSKRKQI